MCPTIIQQQTRLLKISWILLSCQRHRDSWLWNNSYRISTDWRSYGRGLTESYWCSNNWNGNIWYHDYSGGFQKKGKWTWFTLWYYPVFWTIHLVGELPPGNDHIHQIVFIVISLLGLLLPVRQLFSRNMVKS